MKERELRVSKNVVVDCMAEYVIMENAWARHVQGADMPSHKYDDKVMKQEKISDKKRTKRHQHN